MERDYVNPKRDSKIELQTPNLIKKSWDLNSYTKSKSHMNRYHRNFEGLYLHNTDREFDREPHLLYQGGSPVNKCKFEDNYKALPLSVAKINFKHESKHLSIKLKKQHSDKMIPTSKIISYNNPQR
jgi:hypothetical protein